MDFYPLKSRDLSIKNLVNNCQKEKGMLQGDVLNPRAHYEPICLKKIGCFFIIGTFNWLGCILPAMFENMEAVQEGIDG